MFTHVVLMPYSYVHSCCRLKVNLLHYCYLSSNIWKPITPVSQYSSKSVFTRLYLLTVLSFDTHNWFYLYRFNIETITVRCNLKFKTVHYCCCARSISKLITFVSQYWTKSVFTTLDYLIILGNKANHCSLFLFVGPFW